MQIQQAFDTAAHDTEAQLRQLRYLVNDTALFSDAQDAAFISLMETLDQAGRKIAALRHSLLTGEDPSPISEPETASIKEAPEEEAPAIDPREKWIKNSYHLPFDTNLATQFMSLKPYSFSEGVTRFYTAKDDAGMAYLILDDRANLARLDNPDDRPLRDQLKDRLLYVHQFDSVGDLDAYLVEQGKWISNSIQVIRQEDEDEEGGSATSPAVVTGPVPTRPGGATRTFEEAEQPPRNP